MLHFLADFYSMGNKIFKITKLFDRLVQLKTGGSLIGQKKQAGCCPDN